MMFALLISVLLCLLSFPNAFLNDGFWPAAWFALAPLFVCLKSADIKTRLRIGFVFGGCFYSLLLSWLWPVHAAGTMLFVFCLAIQPIVFTLFYRTFQQPSLNLLYIPSLWVASEWLRTIFLNGFHFSFGYSQTFMPNLIQPASWGGAYAVVFLVVLVNYCLFASWQFPLKRKFYLGLAAVIFLINFTYGTWRLSEVSSNDVPFSISGIQPDIAPDKKGSLKDFDDNMETHIGLTKAVLENKTADMVVWPETSFPADIFKDDVWFGRLKQLAEETKTVLLFGAAPVENGKNFNSAVILDVNGNTAGIYHKNLLVPFSEYQPRTRLWSRLPEFIYANSLDFTPGKKQDAFHVRTNNRRMMDFGVLICSETCYPSAARKLVSRGAGFLVVMLNDGWFKNSSAMMMHAQNAVMRAVETGRDIVSVANTGLTFRVTHLGVIGQKERLELQRRQAGIFSVSPRSHPTAYSIIGDFFAEACALFVIIILLFQNKIRFKNP